MQHPKIFVQDNFFEDTFLKQLQKEIVTLEFSSRYQETADDERNAHVDQKIYHQVGLSQESKVVLKVKENIKKYFSVYIEGMNSYYFLSFPNTHAIPHKDGSVYNCIIYLLGDPLINNGTGFYEKDGDVSHLHTHIGFKENRAILFSSSIWHSPLQFAGNSTPRYIMANFISVTDKYIYSDEKAKICKK